MLPPARRDPSLPDQTTPSTGQRVLRLIVEGGVKKVGSIVMGVIATALIAWAAGSYGVVATAAGFLVIGAMLGRWFLAPADEKALAYYNASEFDKKREAWPVDRALVFHSSAEVNPGGRLTVFLRVTNVSPVAWTILGGVVNKAGFIVSYGIELASDMVVGSHGVTVDQGQSTTLVFTGAVSVPKGIELHKEQHRWGLFGEYEQVPILRVLAPERPLDELRAPVLDRSVLANGETWTSRVRFNIRVTDT